MGLLREPKTTGNFPRNFAAEPLNQRNTKSHEKRKEQGKKSSLSDFP
jgi:hypothetical protein